MNEWKASAAASITQRQFMLQPSFQIKQVLFCMYKMLYKWVIVIYFSITINVILWSNLLIIFSLDPRYTMDVDDKTQKSKINNIFFRNFFKSCIYSNIESNIFNKPTWNKMVVSQERNMASKNSILNKVIFTGSRGQDIDISFLEPQLNPTSNNKIRHSLFKIILLFCTFSLSLCSFFKCICQDQTNLLTMIFLTFKITFGEMNILNYVVFLLEKRRKLLGLDVKIYTFRYCWKSL